jgi:DNA repair exonuclease SbcCD nuclease subunit
MTKPYLLVADIHAHKWSHFSTVDPSGINSRLLIILNELERAAAELMERGGDIMIIAGDLFHVRGAIAPDVFNPTFNMIKRILGHGIKIYAIPGNHDLADKDTTELGNAFQSMGSLDGVPDSGLSAKEVASWGFGRVFAGDYHNHRVAEDGKVVSIGATTQQTWSDLGSKAGYVFVYKDRIEYRATHAPSFVEVDAETDPDEIPLIVDGNYVRVRGIKLTDAEVNVFRKDLEEMGARAVTFQITREVVAARSGSALAKATTLDESVHTYIDGMSIEDPALISMVKTSATEILNTVRSVAA